MDTTDAEVPTVRGRQQSISDLMDIFNDLSIEDPVQIIVGEVTINCCVHRVNRSNHHLTVLFTTFANDYLRVETEWANGWLDPQVDRLKPVAEKRQPIGELQAIHPLP